MASPFVKEENLPDSGRTKPPQKTLASASGFCKSGIVTSLLLQFQFLEGPPPGGFSFLSGHWISFGLS
jgi:hypothetical protein